MGTRGVKKKMSLLRHEFSLYIALFSPFLEHCGEPYLGSYQQRSYIKLSFSCLHSPTDFFWSAVVCLTCKQASAEKNHVHTTEAVT